MYDFVALDVETANQKYSSICSIGAVRFEDRAPVAEFYELIDPRVKFDEFNTAIHGIAKSDVRGAPTFAQVLPNLIAFVSNHTVVHHTHFDRSAIRQAADEWKVAAPAWAWLDTAKVTRRAWHRLAHRGYGLANVCEMIGYEFDHHHALADARACGEVLLAAAREHPGVDLVALASQPLQGRSGSARARSVAAR